MGKLDQNLEVEVQALEMLDIGIDTDFHLLVPLAYEASV